MSRIFSQRKNFSLGHEFFKHCSKAFCFQAFKLLCGGSGWDTSLLFLTQTCGTIDDRVQEGRGCWRPVWLPHSSRRAAERLPAAGAHRAPSAPACALCWPPAHVLSMVSHDSLSCTAGWTELVFPQFLSGNVPNLGYVLRLLCLE